MVLQYAQWALDRNQEEAARVFTERVDGEKSEQLKPSFLLDFLKPYPDATLIYLEYLVNDKNLMVVNVRCYQTTPASAIQGHVNCMWKDMLKLHTHL